MAAIHSQFAGKKIFITGHTGFKGCWLSFWLHTLGANVKGYSLPPNTTPNLFESLVIGNNIESVFGDINHFEKLKNEITAFKPDFLFHLAAQPLVRQSYNDPLETFQTNVTGTANVLQALRFVENPCVCIVITTDKVYYNNEWVFPYREIDRLGGYDPYSASKACSELVVSAFTNSFFNLANYPVHQKAIATARAGNVIGGGDWSADRLLPDVVKAITKGEEIILRNPIAIRPWQHVMEPLSGYLSLALHLASHPQKYAGAWNFGPHSTDTISVAELANIAVNTWGSGKISISKDPTAPHEAQLLRLDITKATDGLHWTPRLNSKEAVERSISWYKKFYSGIKAEQLVTEDLNFYKTLLN